MINRNRRGMLLLVVLALLAMFAMMSVAFVVMTGAALSSAIKMQQIEVQSDPPQKQLNDAAKIVVGGSQIMPSQANNQIYFPTSAITWQSLLEKEDGFETIGTLNNSCTMSLSNVTQVCAPTGGTAGQLMDFPLPLTNPGTDVYMTSAGTPMAVDPFHCVGCVLTMLDGPAAGLSTRIVSVNPKLNPQTGTYNVQIVAFENGILPVTTAYPVAHYIVNGFPYSGMGFGYSPQTGALNGVIKATIGSSQIKSPLAFLPNAPPWAWGLAGGTNGIIAGGVNTDYTAPDNQDPLVALATSDGSGGVIVPTPSLHRSDLIAYQMEQNNIKSVNSFSSTNVGLLRQIMFRPNWVDNQNFTGSNPNFNPIWDGVTPGAGQWDVDNMGRGRPDSVWVDLGMPVRYMPDGKAYKPLFAILCLDMDGRLNLNAHGSLAQANPSYYNNNAQGLQSYQYLNSGGYNFDTGLVSSWGSLTGGRTTGGTLAYYAGPAGSQTVVPPVVLARGQGTGPAEVNLLPLFRNSATPPIFDLQSYQNYRYLLSGNNQPGNNAIMGRYGPGTGGAFPSALPGVAGGATPGSMLTMNNNFPYSGVLGGNFWTSSFANWDAHGAPPDPQTAGAIGLDNAGRMIHISFGGQVANGPYDLDLTRNAPHAVDRATVNDAFSVAEMERILRWPDRDATTLPPRLANLTLSGGTSVLNGRCAEITVESNYVPVSPAALPPGVRQYLPQYRSVHPVDIIYAQIYKNYPGNLQLAQSAAAQLLPWEVLQGLKMDINRPFGAGAFSLGSAGQLDSSVYGVPPGKWQRVLPNQPGMYGETVRQYVSSGQSAVTTTFNYTADAGVSSKSPPVPGAGIAAPSAINDSLAARQLYARHLYVLTLSLVDSGAVLQDLRKTNPNAANTDVLRFFAQWAVNVVAYRDHNNIMIPFDYDVNPFTPAGWSPDRNDKSSADTVSHTVWGCKRPELLITETLAFHDRRTQDLPNETVNSNKPYGPLGTQPNPKRKKPGLTTDTDSTTKNKDPGFNSAYRPQGSLFVELFNPWPAMAPQMPDLAPSGGTGAELTKLSGPSGSPVWRMIIVDPTKQPSSAVLNPNGDELPDPDNPNPDPTNPRISARPVIERVAYFVPLQGLPYPTTDDRGNQVVSYYPSATNSRQIIVAPGGYAVVGSGDHQQGNYTYIGFPTSGPPASLAAKPSGNSRWITMNQNDVATGDPRVLKSTVDPMQPNAAPAQVLGIDQAIPAGNGIGASQRLSVSEPTKGYAYYEHQPSGTGNNNGASVSYVATSGKYGSTLDIPVDEQRSIVDKEKFGNTDIWKILNNNGTVSGFRIIYLQRLADPTRPFVAESAANPRTWNPYRTVDAMSVDLTCFNGVATDAGKGLDPPLTTNPSFESRQRGAQNYMTSPAPAAPAVSEANLWKQEPALKFAPVPPGTGWTAMGKSGGGVAMPLNYVTLPLSASLGYLNTFYGRPMANPRGDPQYPFPLLHWAYRPFNNVYELMLVPTVSSSRLLARNETNERGYYGYMDRNARTQTDAGGNYTPPASYDGSSPSNVPYPHLLNFFESKQSSGAQVPAPPGKIATNASAQFHRLLYYLGVPSRFANVQLQMQAYNAGLNSTTTPQQQGPAHWFHTPFNRISRYREPGMINLNTVTSADVLFGAMNAYYSPLQLNSQLNPVFWDKFVRSRRGDAVASSGTVALGSQPSPTTTQQSLMNMFAINPKVPSRFMRPYRTPGGAFLMPPNYQGQSAEPARETDVTFLRDDPDVAERPLLEVDDYLMYRMNNVGFPAANATPDQFPLAAMDYNRGANFRYQLMQKLGSTASTHSNVFAIWITVGYFEVMPAPNGADAGHPDGWQLGQEVGADTGDVTRHRAFFIFDRSLPVGFVRGQDINSDKAFLLKRFIE